MSIESNKNVETASQNEQQVSKINQNPKSSPNTNNTAKKNTEDRGNTQEIVNMKVAKKTLSRWWLRQSHRRTWLDAVEDVHESRKNMEADRSAWKIWDVKRKKKKEKRKELNKQGEKKSRKKNQKETMLEKLSKKRLKEQETD